VRLQAPWLRVGWNLVFDFGEEMMKAAQLPRQRWVQPNVHPAHEVEAMVEFLDRASAWPRRLIETAVIARVPTSVAVTLPGFFAAVGSGRYGASVAHLLPLLGVAETKADTERIA
jgi:hypothetical protein